MSTATFNHIQPVHVGPPHSGATALGSAPHSGPHAPHRVGDALRAVKVFVTAAFSVAVLGEYGEEAGILR
ncbi:hypothetical protein GCM10011583_52480 [Streptomyces camponoticapitis]|uniref:Uncharacterized protein n=1 Tax=Streptomyces camponoticapitis TaxID=1616125 RepID=A0ABQ2ELU4_9ACTN|nr:hypothetical protein [Streptomyces camponoticapitis]GGK13981.1 hypothetical protein GCM10011583_52480 [Streptomyces camponoticapitis]